MKVTGIIAEYDPFHNGHRYHIEKARALTGAQFVIVIMSGDFVQRGKPACMDKYTRTRHALMGGADLVIELPVEYATGSASYFAGGAIALLDRMGVADSLCFGSESDDISALIAAARILADEPEELAENIRARTRQGESFPAARSAALSGYLQSHPVTGADPLSIVRVLSSPNNILAVEYIKALMKRGSSIRPIAVKRSNDYFSDTLTAPYCSSTAIRNALFGRDSADHMALTRRLDAIRSCVPDEVFGYMLSDYGITFPILPDDLSQMLFYRLLTASEGPLACYSDVSGELESRIRDSLDQALSFSSLAESVKCRSYTRSRIDRALLHILLGIRGDDLEKDIAGDYVRYARILGFRKNSTRLLSQLKASSSVPLITKLADADTILDEDGLAMLERDIHAADIYRSLQRSRFGCAPKNEYTQGIIMI